MPEYHKNIPSHDTHWKMIDDEVAPFSKQRSFFTGIYGQQVSVQIRKSKNEIRLIFNEKRQVSVFLKHSYCKVIWGNICGDFTYQFCYDFQKKA